MHLKLLTLCYDPEIGGFPPDPLLDIEGEVVLLTNSQVVEIPRRRPTSLAEPVHVPA